MGTPELWHCIRAVARAATLSIRQTVPVSRRGLASIAATGESGSSPAISTSPTGLPRLSSGQAALLSRLRRGESVYFTGKAGAGKTEVLRRFIDECKNDPARRYATEVTAPTGIAAAHIGGGTLYSTFGLKPSIDLSANSSEEIIKRCHASNQLLARYVFTSTLIIDEISMVNKRDFESISKTMSTLKADHKACSRAWTFMSERFKRKGLTEEQITIAMGGLKSEGQLLERGRASKDKPFGGAQVVLCGDFFQLPPIEKETEELHNYRKAVTDLYSPSGDGNMSVEHLQQLEHILSPYVFTSREWVRLKRCGMKLILLDKSFRQTDAAFVSFLDRLRVGEWDDEMHSLLKTRLMKFDKGNIRPIKLCAYRKTAHDYNARKLAQLKGSIYHFPSSDNVMDEEQFLAPPVMGAGEDSTPEGPIVIEKPSELSKSLIHEYAAEFSSLPVPDIVSLRIGAQVVLAKNMDIPSGLVNGTRGRVVGFEETLDEITGQMVLLPIVEFKLSRSSGGTVEKVIGYHVFESQVSMTRVIVRRQIPLRLGWGLTVHRAQGMTLDSVIVDMPRTFAPGQAYVAMSRVKSLEGLCVTRNLNRKTVLVSDLVTEFYRNLSEESITDGGCGADSSLYI